MAKIALFCHIIRLIPEDYLVRAGFQARLTTITFFFFYEYNSMHMEAWDGPAGVVLTDGRYAACTLDRNGLRPARYLITDDDLVVMGSEMGVLEIPEEKIVKKWRLQPGKMFLIDMEQGRIIDDEELKHELATSKPYQQWLDMTQISIKDLTDPVITPLAPDDRMLLDLQQAFGYTQEDIKFLLTPMVATGMEATGSMGADNPPSVLSNRAKHISTYFKQHFAQVTNPPMHPIREEIVTAVSSTVGSSFSSMLNRAPGSSSAARSKTCSRVGIGVPGRLRRGGSGNFRRSGLSEPQS